jgi:thiol-disulfide isomerase/thioredoxin
VNFFKPSFNPCKYFNPKFQRMAAELGEHATFLQVDCEHYRMRKWARVEENVTQFPTFKFFQFGSELLQTIGTNETRMRQLILQHGKEAKDISTKKIKTLTTTQEFQNMKSVQERLLVIAYTAKSCFFSARSAPLLEEINTRMVKYADFARVDVDNPTFRQMCAEEDVTGTPSIRMYYNGKRVAGFAGCNGLEIRKVMDRILKDHHRAKPMEQ